MKVNSVSILSTRNLDEAMFEKAAGQNIIIDALDFIETKKRVTEEVAEQIEQLAKENATVVFTSLNSVKAVAETISSPAKPIWNIYSTAGATFNLITRLFPFCHIISKAVNAEEVAKEIAKHKVKEVTFFCGNKSRDELPNLLRQEKVSLTEMVVYETIETPVKLTRTYDGILFFSPSAVNSFFFNNKISEKTVFFAIGETTANAVKQFCSNIIIVSDFPAKEKLAQKAVEYFINKC